MRRLNSLEELVLCGCSKLESLNMGLEHHQGRRMHQSDRIVASTSYITSLQLKLFSPSRFSEMKNSRFTSFTLPYSLTTLNFSRTPICFLPPSIKDIGTLNYLSLAECKMLQTLLELPSSLVALDMSYCYSLQRIANVIPFTIARDCDQLFTSKI